MVDTRRLILRYEGLFDQTALYQLIINFFKQRKYEYVETNWKEKEASPIGREVTVKMEPYKYISEYVTYKYKVVWLMIDAHWVDVVRSGRATKLMHSRFNITITAQVELDWQGLGAKHGKTKKLFEKHVINKEIAEVYVPNLLQEQQHLMDLIKQQLQMESTRQEKGVVNG